MEILSLKHTEYTPGVTLNHNIHLLEFTHESRPENVKTFFPQIYKWIEEYESYLYFIANKQHEKITINCNFKLDYFNSSSAKSLLQVMEMLHKISEKIKNSTLVINWYYLSDDEDMKHTGEELKKLTGCDFKFFEYDGNQYE